MDDISFSPQRTTVGGGWRCRAGARAPVHHYRSPGRTFGSEHGTGFHPKNKRWRKIKVKTFPFLKVALNSRNDEGINVKRAPNSNNSMFYLVSSCYNKSCSSNTGFNGHTRALLTSLKTNFWSAGTGFPRPLHSWTVR